VLLRWLARSWTAALPKFDAMFAFGAGTTVARSCCLPETRSGKSPSSTHTPAPGILVFGSEIKALLQHPAVDRQLNMDALRQALRFRAVYGTAACTRACANLSLEPISSSTAMEPALAVSTT
jgi:asparagine synthase (glutamine-hydrolysing)